MIGVKLREEDYQKLLTAKGQISISEYVRGLIVDSHQGVKNEVEDFRELISDVSWIKQKLVSTASHTDSEFDAMMVLLVSIIESMAGAKNHLMKKDPDLYAKLKL